MARARGDHAFKVGDLLLVLHGGSYTKTHPPFVRVIVPFTKQEVSDAFIAKYKLEGGLQKPLAEHFPPYLMALGFVEDIPIHAWDVGGYSFKGVDK